MKVVILKPIKGLGKIGDVVEVKDGFGRNYLIPNKFAARATAENLKFFEERKKDLEENNKKYVAEASAQAKKLENKDFTFIRQASDDGRLFGSVSAKEIATEISKQVSGIHYSSVILHTPIKSLGVYEVNLHLHVEVDVKVIINIARSETEAAQAITTFKNQAQAETSAA